MSLFVAMLGWAGAILVLASYVLLSTRRIDGHSLTYHVINLLGAIGVGANSAWNGAIPSTAVNVIWMGIAIYALVRHANTEPESGAH